MFEFIKRKIWKKIFVETIFFPAELFEIIAKSSGKSGSPKGGEKAFPALFLPRGVWAENFKPEGGGKMKYDICAGCNYYDESIKTILNGSEKKAYTNCLAGNRPDSKGMCIYKIENGVSK